MKPLLFVVLLTACFYSCTTGSRNTTLSASDTLAVAVSAPEGVPSGQSPQPVSLTPVKDPAPFWRAQDIGSVIASRQSGSETPLNGFFGADHYRIEVFFETVRKDPRQPSRYLLTGKTRHKKRIAAFQGELTLDSLFAVTDPHFPADLNPDIRQLVAATGTFSLPESGISDPGIFSGRFGIVLAQEKDGKLRVWTGGRGAPDGGAGFVFGGDWRRAGEQKPFLVAHDFRVIGDQVLTNFSFPDRSRGINPKYRRLGWDTLMAADEWWNEPAR